MERFLLTPRAWDPLRCGGPRRCWRLGSIAFRACGSDSVSRGGEPRTGSAADAARASDASPPEPDAGTTPRRAEVEVRRSFNAAGRQTLRLSPTRRATQWPIIDSRTLAIQTMEAGDGPNASPPCPAATIALVINVTSH